MVNTTAVTEKSSSQINICYMVGKHGPFNLVWDKDAPLSEASKKIMKFAESLNVLPGFTY